MRNKAKEEEREGGRRRVRKGESGRKIMHEKKIWVIVITICVIVQTCQLMKGVKSGGGTRNQLIRLFLYFLVGKLTVDNGGVNI